MAAISLRNVLKTYGQGPKATPVIHGLNAEVKQGEFVVIVGPSGCGKSTVIDLLLGLLPPDRGQLQVDGRPLAAGSPRLRRWQAGLASMGAAVPLVPGSVRTNLELAFGEASPPPAQELDDLLALVELEGLLDRPLGEAGRQLSGGPARAAPVPCQPRERDWRAHSQPGLAGAHSKCQTTTQLGLACSCCPTTETCRG